MEEIEGREKWRERGEKGEREMIGRERGEERESHKR